MDTVCGRFSRIQGVDVILDTFGLDSGIDINPSYNVAPRTMIPGILQKVSKKLQLLQWGMVPSWSRSKEMAYSYINIRSEGLLDKKTTAKLIQTQRCIIPASGFYEWKKEKSKKIPYYFYISDQPLFGMAGLYSVWTDGNEELHSCAIITTQSNSVVNEVHSRMPVILSRDRIQPWLHSDYDNLALGELFSPYPEDLTRMYQVSTSVNSVKNDAPSLLDKYEETTHSTIDDYF